MPSAQARVRAEIEAHYAEAVQGHLDNGRSEAAANAAALAELGDAGTAARRLKREHLTKKEAMYVDWRLKSAMHPLWLMLGVLIFPALVMPLVQTLPMDDSYSKFWAGAAIVLSFVQIALIFGTGFLAGQKNTPMLLRQILLLDSIAIFNLVGLALVCAREGMHGDGQQAKEIIYGLGFALYMAWISRDTVPLNFLRLRRKLKSASEDDLRPT